ncbi:hypothetical protein CHLRE_09g403404v5 [Chlamydomonas reinhardtii]|uniref:Uncharacterized protein n=1 Tax=Chlamydomonas reinhardtii TaxID=3055 RepID=A0A2K3DF74_CHLRE|nr:uncharacterized protein CHLRE_09g403404v5 [Chlamydomonas reinhardtii]PNW79179.1 hypothetical protein CHLRE_09g403404v5 [Chlamydomonas reinhardtii]
MLSSSLRLAYSWQRQPRRLCCWRAAGWAPGRLSGVLCAWTVCRSPAAKRVESFGGLMASEGGGISSRWSGVVIWRT